MTAGLQVVGSNGNFQIDNMNLSFVLARKVTRTTTAGGYGCSTDTITYNNGEIIALRSAQPVSLEWAGGGQAGICGYNKNGNSNDPITYTAYIFKNSPSTPANGAGLQVFNAAGASIFYSGDKNLRIVAITTGHGTYHFNAQRQYAAVFLNSKVSIEDNLGGVQGNMIFTRVRMMSYIRQNASGITAEYVPDWSWVTVNPDNFLGYAECSSPTCNLAIIDVTGF